MAPALPQIISYQACLLGPMVLSHHLPLLASRPHSLSLQVGTFSVASEEVLRSRAIKKAKRRNPGTEVSAQPLLGPSGCGSWGRWGGELQKPVSIRIGQVESLD